MAGVATREEGRRQLPAVILTVITIVAIVRSIIAVFNLLLLKIVL